MNQKRFEAARVSLTGDRKMNQDRSLILTEGGTTLLLLGDGLGGHPRGEVAAQLLADVSESWFRRQEKPLRDPEQFMMQCVHKAHEAIALFGNRQDPPIVPRTTAVIAILQYGMAYWVHVGDSRLYLIRDGHIQAQTKDHSAVRYIRPADSDRCTVRSTITRCLGGPHAPPSLSVGSPTELCIGDVLLLCSDGLWGQIPQDDLVKTLSVESGFVSAVQGLAQEAVKRGYPRSDNVTAVGLRWQPRDGDQDSDDATPTMDDSLNEAVRYLQSVLQNNKH